MDVFDVIKLTFLGILLCFNEAECGAVDGCYSNYLQCYDTYNQVPRPQALTDDWTTYCSAGDTLDTCLKDDVRNCQPDVVAPAQYTQFTQTAADTKKSCKLTTCTNLQLKCAAEYANATSHLSSEPVQEGFAKLCEALPNSKACYSIYFVTCNEPAFTTGMSNLLESIDQQIAGCQVALPSGACVTKSLQCVNLTMGIMPNINPDDPDAMLKQFSAMCPVLGQLKDCYTGLIAECPTFVNASSAALSGFQMAELFCGDGSVNCALKIQECSAPMAAYPNCSNVETMDTLSLAEGVNCCKLAADTTKCLQDNGCGMIVSSYPALHRSEALCRGYNDYCPEMFGCFEATYQTGGFNTPAEMCSNVGGFITCIEEKCANKPQIGQQTFTKIKDVFNKICGVVSKYPTIGICSAFTSCIEKAPSLPGTVSSIQSFVSARNTDRWCQIAKSYVGCGVTAGTGCNQVATLITDVSAAKTTTDEACTGVRGPCLTVNDCLATLKGSQTELMFKTTCPNIPGFVTCTENALKACGDGSRVKADYSLVDVKDLFAETCQAMNDGLYKCAAINPCLDLQLPLNAGDLIEQASDQTSWCRKLNRMLKCTADVSTACQQPKAIHDKFMMLYHKVSKHCPPPNYKPPKPVEVDDDDNGASAIRVTGVFVITGFFMIFI